MTRRGTRKELEAIAKEALNFGPSELGQELTKSFQTEVIVPEKSALEATFGGWAIRDDDLDLFKLVGGAFTTVAGATFALAGLTPAGIAALALAVVTLLRNVYRAGMTLTPEQVQVVAGLRHAGQPVKADALTDILNYRTQALDAWTETTTRATLESLLEVPTKAKGLVAIVQKTKDARWLLAGV